MDTKNKEFQEALNELFNAVVKVMRLAGAGCYSDAVKNKFVLTKLTEFIASLEQSSPCIENKEDNFNKCQEPLENTAGSNVTLVGTRYATAPEEDEDGVFFRRTVEMKTEDDSRYYTINIYSDGTCTFEMKDDVKGQKLQTLVDNKDTLLNSKVVIYSGTPNSNSKIETISVGKAEKRGKSYIILSPLKIVFT